MHRPTLVVGLATIAVMLLVERFAHRLPAAMVALVLGIVASHVFDEALRQLTGRLAEAGIPLALARIHGPAIDLLEKTGMSMPSAASASEGGSKMPFGRSSPDRSGEETTNGPGGARAKGTSASTRRETTVGARSA